MKYKIGDVVKLKSAEELIKLGCGNGASSCAGGKEVLIVGFYGDKYVMKFLENENFLCFKEIYIEKIINKANLLETYTFDELKAKVDEFREYIVCFEKKNFCMIDIGFTTSKTMIEAYNKYVVETNINIF